MRRAELVVNGIALGVAAVVFGVPAILVLAIGDPSLSLLTLMAIFVLTVLVLAGVVLVVMVKACDD